MTRQKIAPIAILAGAMVTGAVTLWSLRQGHGIPLDFGSKRSILAVGGLALLFGGIAGALPAALRRWGEALLLALAAGSVVLSSDILTKVVVVESFTLPQVGIRLLALLLVAAGLWLGGMTLFSSQEDDEASSEAVKQDIRSLGSVLGLGALLGMLTLLMHQYHVESALVYHNLMQVLLYGFLLHHLLLPRLRLTFCLLLSLACFLGVFGLYDGAWLLGIGFGLIGLCHLPFSFRIRLALLLLVVAVLVVLRIGFVSLPFSGAVWPILGSLFMFRLIVYVYEIKHAREKLPLVPSLAYFFLLPNLAFPLFPVVDYSAFRRTYYDKDALSIYRSGLAWMYLGVLHLLCYRAVSYYLVLPPNEINSGARLVQHLLANFLLYLRLSGQFHLIVGMLHLFGFNLPLTHHLYYLSSSFTDFWRRINIYWKDFMLKVFFNPTYFQLRKGGAERALVISTFWVFFATWFFHAYQWFWLRGKWLWTVPDVLFWSILAVLVAVNSVWETKRGRERSMGRRAWSLGEFLPIAIRTLGTFTVICLLWSLWSCNTMGEWLNLWTGAGLGWSGWGVVGILFGLLLVILGETLRIRRGVAAAAGGANLAAETPHRGWGGFDRTEWATVGVALVLCGLGSGRVQALLPGSTRAWVGELTEAKLNRKDAALFQRGYYEDLIGVDRFNSELWELYTKRPTDWKGLVDMLPDTGDFLRYKLEPNSTVNYKNAPLIINRWGIRDKDYEQKRPANTYRIALLGPSHVMGSGVRNEETFETLLETRLNAEKRDSSYTRCEILNFAVGGYTPFQELWTLEKRIFDFQPNAVFYVSHPFEMNSIVRHIANRSVKGITNPFDYVRALEQKVGVQKGMTEEEATQRLSPHQEELLGWLYQRVAQECRKRNVLPVWVYLPTLEKVQGSPIVATLKPLAEKAGFTIVDLSDVYANHSWESLVVAEWDNHPNIKGHQVIAGRLYQALQETKKIPLGLPPREQVATSAQPLQGRQ